MVFHLTDEEVNSLQEAMETFRRLNECEVMPSKVVGKGFKNPKRSAYRYLYERIKNILEKVLL